MVHQANLVRPTSSSYSSSKSTDNQIVLKRRTSALILTLIATVIFLFVLLLFLLCALVFLGKSLAKQQVSDSQHDIVSYFIDNNHFDKIKTNLLLPNIKIDSTEVRLEQSSNKHEMQKVIEHLTFRIPRQITPISYNLFLHPNLKNKSFSGNVQIQFNISEQIPVIALHSKKLNVTTNNLNKLLVNGMEAIPIKSSFSYDPFEFWIVEPEKPITAGDYSLNLTFSGSLDKSIVGFYGSSYYDKIKNEKRYIATSKFEPTYARQAFPCFDEPAMKAEFKISLIRPADKEYSALSNMPMKDEEPYGDGLVKTNFENSVPMSTYLTVFIVSDFEYISQEIDVPGFKPFTLRAFATPAQKEKLNFALKTGADVIKFYINYFNIEYPLPKLDMAAIPDFVSGAMETWGLVTYRETNLIYDPENSSTNNKQRVAAVIAHEFAHMWFGNLVTMKWWNDLFLNEGFASYIEFKGIHAAHPSWEIENQFTIDTMHSIMNLDATLGSHPIVVGVETPDQITEIFDGITYNKGASIIRMLEDFVGEENFKNGVTNYLKEHKYSNADANDLLTQLAKEVEIDVFGIMDTWLKQRGYPVVNVERVNATTFRLVQRRFLTDPNSEARETEKSPFNYRWSIPITYFTDTNKTVQRQWFFYDDTELLITVPEETQYIKINKNQVGFYRVNYDEFMWETLNAALESNIEQMSVLDRAHLLHDAFSLASAQQLDYSVALEMTKYLSKENSFVPWDVVSSKLKGIRNLLYAHPKIYTDFKDYVNSLVNDAYKKVDWDVKPADQGHIENLFRSTILDLACSMGHPECLKKAGEEFKKWISDTSKRPNPDLKSIVYFYGMQSIGTEADWNKMFEVFEKEQDAQEKVKLQSALAAIQDRLVLKRFIEIADDENGPIRSQDFFSCLTSISNNRNGEDIVWEYVRENWQRFIDRFGLNERYLGRLIPSITGRFATQTRLEEMRAFFGKYPEAGAGANARVEAQETVQNNINWLAKNKNPIKDWLKKNSNNI